MKHWKRRQNLRKSILYCYYCFYWYYCAEYVLYRRRFLSNKINELKVGQITLCGKYMIRVCNFYFIPQIKYIKYCQGLKVNVEIQKTESVKAWHFSIYFSTLLSFWPLEKSDLFKIPQCIWIDNFSLPFFLSHSNQMHS